MQLKQFDNEDGIELYIDMETGASFASQSGYARMAGVPESTLRRRLYQSEKITLQGHENLSMSKELTSPNCIVQTQFRDSKNKKRAVNLLNEDWIVKNLGKDNPPLLVKMSKLGVRATLHKMVGFDVKSEPSTPKTWEDACIALADQIKAHREDVKQLQSQIGNAKQKVKDNLNQFEGYFDENLSLEENIDKFGEIIITYKKQVMLLEHQKNKLKNSVKDNVNHFTYCKNDCIFDDGSRRSFGRLVKKVCEKYEFDFDERTSNKNGFDLNINHYPISVLERIYDLTNSGYNNAFIIETYVELE